MSTTFESRLRYYLERENFFQKDLAAQLHISTSLLNKHIKGRASISSSRLQRICEILELTREETEELFDLARISKKEPTLSQRQRQDEDHQDILQGAELQFLSEEQKFTQLDQLQPSVFRTQSPPLQRPPRDDYFTGRSEDLNWLIEVTQPGRAVTLCGPGGIGKTTLVAELIWKLAPDDKPPQSFPDGVIFHDFYKERQVEVALGNVVRAFGEKAYPNTVIAAQNLLAERTALVVLDGAENADDLRLITRMRGRCAIVITTRRRQDADNHQYRRDLRQLQPQEAQSILVNWSGRQNTDSEIVSQIYELVGGLPLAMRLIGRYLAETGSTEAEYLMWLKQNKLEALDFNNPQHSHESVTLLLNRSFEQLSDAAKQTLNVVGLLGYDFFESEIVKAALGVSEATTRKSLGELVNYSLLTRPQSRSLYKTTHALIYTYSANLENNSKYILKQLVSYYVAFLEEHATLKEEDQHRLSMNRPHMLNILNACLKWEAWEEVKILSQPLRSYLSSQNRISEEIEVDKIALPAARARQDRKSEGWHLNNLGCMYRAIGHLPTAIEYHIESIQVMRQINDNAGVSTFLCSLGWTYSLQGEPSKALQSFGEALAIVREHQLSFQEVICLNGLGCAYRDQGKFDEAIKNFNGALDLALENKFWHWVYSSVNDLSNLYRNQRDTAQAVKYVEKALTIAQSNEHLDREISARRSLANINYEQGNTEQAIRQLEKLLILSQEQKNINNEGNILSDLGHIYHRVGNIERSMEYYNKALTLTKKYEHALDERRIWSGLGSVYSTQKNLEQAAGCYEKALDISRRLQNHSGTLSTLLSLGLLYYKQDTKQALKYFNEGLTFSRQLTDRSYEVKFLKGLGETYFSQEQMSKALEYFEEALRISREVDNRLDISNSIRDVAKTLKALERAEECLKYIQESLKISQEINHWLGIVLDMKNIAVAYYFLGKVEQTIYYIEEAINLCQSKNDRYSEVDCLLFLTKVYYGQHQYEKALQHSQKALAISKAIGDRKNEGVSVGCIGAVYDRLGEFQKANTHIQQALTIARETYDYEHEELWLINLAESYTRLGVIEEAIAACQQATELYPSNPKPYENLANIYIELGRIEEAVSLYEQRTKLSPDDALAAHIHLGIIAFSKNNKVKAKHHLETFLNIWEATRKSNNYTPATLYKYKALALLVLEKPRQAVEALNEAFTNWQPSDEIDFTLLNILSSNESETLEGLKEMRQLLEQFAGDNPEG